MPRGILIFCLGWLLIYMGMLTAPRWNKTGIRFTAVHFGVSLAAAVVMAAVVGFIVYAF